MPNWQDMFNQRQQVLEREKFLTIGVFDPHGQRPSFIYVDQDLELAFSLMMVGIPPQSGHLIITETRRALLAQGIRAPEQLPERLLLPDVANLPSHLVAAPANVRAGAFHYDGPVFQIVWPDTEGRFPGDADMDARMRWLQGWGDWEGRGLLNLDPKPHLPGFEARAVQA